jgi:hypothetical protein
MDASSAGLGKVDPPFLAGSERSVNYAARTAIGFMPQGGS